MFILPALPTLRQLRRVRERVRWAISGRCRQEREERE